MSFVIRLLVVEDDPVERSAWEHVIELHNSQDDEFGFTLSAEYAKSLSEAMKLIDERDFDAAVVDIRLEQGAAVGTNADGNIVVERLLQTELAIVAVFTGEAAEVRTPEWAKPLVQTFRKGGDEGEGTDEVMKWIIRLAPMVQQIRRAQLTIKKEMVRLFTKSIWPRWSEWAANDERGENSTLGLALSRHLISHVHATLLEGSKHKAHPEEWYFIPPIREGIRTGDLVREGANEFEIIITPRCDLAVENKTDTVMLARCGSVSAEWDKRCKKIHDAKAAVAAEADAIKKGSLQKKVEEAEESLRRFTQHNGGKANAHFLPRMRLSDGNAVGPLMVHFDDIRTIRKAEADNISALIKNRVASLAPEFLPSLVERLGGYFSRIGTPDYLHDD